MSAKTVIPDGKVVWTDIKWEVGDLAFTSHNEALRIEGVYPAGSNTVVEVLYVAGRYIDTVDYMSAGDIAPMTQEQLDERSIEDMMAGYVDAPRRADDVRGFALREWPGIATGKSLAKHYRWVARNVEREGVRHRR